MDWAILLLLLVICASVIRFFGIFFNIEDRLNQISEHTHNISIHPPDNKILYKIYDRLGDIHYDLKDILDQGNREIEIIDAISKEQKHISSKISLLSNDEKLSSIHGTIENFRNEFGHAILDMQQKSDNYD